MSPRPDLGPEPRLGYTASNIARVAERRADVGFLAACEADARAGSYAIGGELVVLKKSAGVHDPLFSPVEARRLGDAAEIVFLGLSDGAPRFAIGLDPKDVETLKARDDLLVLDLRSIAVRGLVDADHLPPLAEARRCSTGTRGTGSARIAGPRPT